MGNAEIFGACRSGNPDRAFDAEPSIVACVLDPVTPKICALRATVVVDASPVAADAAIPEPEAPLPDAAVIPDEQTADDGGVGP